MENTIASKITDLLERVPGYTGYRSLENRRDDDKRLRESIASTIYGVVDTLTGVSARAARDRNLGQISALERMVGTTRTLGDRIRTASYGYGGIFTDRPIDESAIEQLRQFDATFQNETARLVSLADRLSNSPEGPLEVDISAFQDELNRLGRLFDARTEVIDSGRPNRDSNVLLMLAPHVEPVPTPFHGMKFGDAFSVGDDDFIADAVLRFDSQGASLTVIRAGEDNDGQEVWFAGGSSEDLPAARLSPMDFAGSPDGSGLAATLTITNADGSKAGTPARYGYTGGSDSTISFWYTVGDETRSYTGASLTDTSIQVYGQA